jgi:spore maturation protein CgeB
MNSPSRFIVAAPLSEGTARVGRDMGRAIAAAGHRVSLFDYDAGSLWLRAVPKPLRTESWRLRWVRSLNESVLHLAREERPDFFFCVKGVQFWPETIRAIGDLGITTAGYWIDDPPQHERSLVNARSYQFYFTNDLGSVPRYRAAGVERIHHLPSSADIGTFHPLPEGTPVADISFVGTRTPRREPILSAVQDFDLLVYGPGWHESALKKSRVRPEAFGSRTNEVFNRSRINLNIHNWTAPGTAMNLRLFEVPAAGGFLLTDWVEEIDAAYKEGEHLACWRDLKELRQKIAYYLSHDEERRAVARRGHEHFLRHHTYAARVRRLLDCLGA